MARIRSIKPEFWTSEQVVELSPTTRLLFIGMWTFCDDRGVHPASCKTLKMEVFPGDDFTASNIEQMMAAIIQAGLVLEYQGFDGKMYWAVTGWEKHQKVEKPNFKHPEPPKIADHSPTNRRLIADHSTTGGKGGEGKGREMELEGRGGAIDENPTTRPAKNSSNDENPNPTTPPQTSAFTQIRQAIQQWQDADNGEALRKIASDQKYLGQIEPEITRFITNNLGKDPYRERITRAPLDFFQEQFPGWLCLPAAQRASKAHVNGSGQQSGSSTYTRPTLRDQQADQHRTRESAMQLIQNLYPDISDQFTEKHIQTIRTMASNRSATEMVHAMAKTIHNGPAPPRKNGNAHSVSTIGLNINGL